ncbi:DNA polymerase III subunit delta [Colwellia psychrerythraea]|uniref:DNA polymerase III subunit delta n=1 Tax=Colwellia psychrerythraea TaxID=28229 RepID=A0A099KWP5_COLPS|nr:DNA polymerase III subunit delta [Colwellia psychrerythraea]KGJ95129.1 DNA polymerase III, delta subunit [Colwellia psychrerythraea]
MKIYHNQLDNTLQQGFKPVWLVFGDEPWQKDNSLAVIKSHAKKQGFSEIIRFSSDISFDWQQLLDEYQALSLFASQRIIEVELTTVKVGDAGNKALLALAERLIQDFNSNNAPQDVMFIFHGAKLDAASANRKWFKSLAQLGCYLPLYDIELKAMPQWLNNQARQRQLTISAELNALLTELFEGNLLALGQELDKLALLFGSQPISIEQAEQLILKQAKFNPFQVIDALLKGDCAKCITMLDQLQQEGMAPAQLIWIFHKEVNQLYTMLNQLEQGEGIANVYKQYRIWDKRKPLYQHALTHIKLANVKRAMIRIADIDLLSKTSSEFNIFILLADLCITLYHGEKTAAFSLNYG